MCRKMICKCLRSRVCRLILVVLAGLWSAVRLPAQPTSAAESLNLNAVRSERASIEKDRSLGDAERAQLLKIYDAAIGALERDLSLRAQALQHEREQAVVALELRRLQAELERPAAPRARPVGEGASSRDIETAHALAQADLLAQQQALREIQKLRERPARRSQEIAGRIAVLNEEVAALAELERTSRDASAPATWKRATQVELLARRQAAAQEIVTLRAEQGGLELQARIAPLQRDRAQRRVAEDERSVLELGQRAAEARRVEAARALEQLRAQCREAEALSPQLKPLAEETGELAFQRYGPVGVRTGREAITRELANARKHNSRVETIAEVTRRKFEAVSLQGVASQWWPRLPGDLPKPAELKRTIRRYETLIPKIEHELIVLSERRVETGDVESEVARHMSAFLEAQPALSRAEVEHHVRGLVASRRQLLDELIGDYTPYAAELQETVAETRMLLRSLEDLDHFTMQRVLWARSVPGGYLPPLESITGGLAWLFLNRQWGAVLAAVGSGMVNNLVFHVAALALLVLLALKRPRFLAVLSGCAARVADPAKDCFADTLQALLATAFVAALVPALLAYAGICFIPAESYDLGRGLSSGFFFLAALTALLLFAAEALRPGGLGEAHFGLRPHVTRPVERGLRQVATILSPLAFVAVALGAEGLRFHGDARVQEFSNGLGRVCFIAAMAMVVRYVYRLLRPRGLIMSEFLSERPKSRVSQLAVLWFPLLLLLSAAPALLAFAGYYVSGYILAFQSFETVVWTVLVVVAGSLVMRWRSVRQARLVARATVRPVTHDEAGAVRASREIELHHSIEAADAQVRHLSRFALSLAWLVGVVLIWSDLLPALSVLRNIQIWPKVRWAEVAQSQRGATQGAALAGNPQQERPEPAAAQEGLKSPAAAALPGAAGLTPGAGTSPVAAATPEGIFLWDLVLAALIIWVTAVTARNLPGLLELALLRHLSLETGVSYAVSTVVRYALFLVGATAAAAALGISWRNVQWLAAALTFGIGFGLQEIFANFVSGLILLFDRSIRVGDAVTVGTMSGRVARIQMRATTITLWDSSEMLVPNKDLITGKLVNWTSSDARTRVEIRVGVAYGTDPEAVRQLLLETANQHPAVYKDPAPFVWLVEFAESAIVFELQVHLHFDYGRLTIQDELRRAILKAFEQHGVVIAYPQLDVHIWPSDPERKGPQRKELGSPGAAQ